MNQSEQINELAGALAKAQGQMKGALKDAANPFFKSKYADLASVTDAIREAFAANGLSYIQRLNSEKEKEVGCETIIMHSSGQWFGNGFLFVPVSKFDAQGFGSAITYIRRYSLSAATGVAPEDDDGNAASNAKPKAVSTATAALAASPHNPEDEAYLKNLAAELVDWVESKGDVVKGFDLWSSAKLDADQQVYITTVLQPNSKTRSALKAEGLKRAEERKLMVLQGAA